MRTKSETCRGWVSSFHLWRCCKFDRYSLYQRDQKLSWICCTNFHRVWSVKRAFGGALLLSVGRECKGAPIRKCPGDSTSISLGSWDIGVKGRELRHASTRASTVLSSSKVNACKPIDRLRRILQLLTAASQSPPKCGALGGIVTHSTPRVAAYALSEDSLLVLKRRSWRAFNSLRAPMKLLPLSEKMVLGRPRRAINLLRPPIQAADVRAETSSIWTAFVAKQTKMKM